MIIWIHKLFQADKPVAIERLGLFEIAIMESGKKYVDTGLWRDYSTGKKCGWLMQQRLSEFSLVWRVHKTASEMAAKKMEGER